MKVLLTSLSPIKKNAVSVFFKSLNKDINLTSIDCTQCGLMAQPVIDDDNEGFFFCKERMNFAKTKVLFSDYDYVISIENGIALGQTLNIEDVCYVLIFHNGLLANGESFGVTFDVKYLDQLKEQDKFVEYNSKIYGYAKLTIGDMITKENPEINPKNWMLKTNNIDRVEQIKWGIKKAYEKMELQLQYKSKLLNALKLYPHFPTEGILFHDTFSLFENPKLLKLLIKLIAKQYKYDVINYVVGLEPLGLCIGPLIAYKLGIGFIPIRKVGHLPGKTKKTAYDTDKDIYEIQVSEMDNKRVLIVDESISTGESMDVAINLVKRLHGTVVDCFALWDQLNKKYVDILDKDGCSVLF